MGSPEVSVHFKQHPTVPEGLWCHRHLFFPWELHAFFSI